jgi:uncharacterized protein
MITKEIFVNADVSANALITCSRCLEEVKQALKHNFRLTYDTNSLGDYLEIDKDLREEMLLNFPMKLLCKPDCKGLCPGCGVNLNFNKCQCRKGVNNGSS